MTPTTRHLLRDDDLSPSELLEVLDLADRMKAAPFDHKPLAGPHTVALVFDRPTLRTQVSFAAGIAELGGNPMTVDGGLAAMGVPRGRRGRRADPRPAGRRHRVAHRPPGRRGDHGRPLRRARPQRPHRRVPPVPAPRRPPDGPRAQGPARRRPGRLRRRRRLQHGQLLGARRGHRRHARRGRRPGRLHPRRARRRPGARDRPGHGRARSSWSPTRWRRSRVPTSSSPTRG